MLFSLFADGSNVDLLKADGGEHVLDTSVEGVDQELHTLTRRILRATLAFDMVGGSLTARVAAAMPRHSKILMVGAVSGEPSA